MSGLRYTDGTSTVTLHDGATGVLQQVRYVPLDPELSAQVVTDALEDGAEVPNATYTLITEDAEIWFYNGEAAARTAVTALNLFFETARHQQKHQYGSKVYVEFRPNNTDAWWRSELLYARAELTDDLLDTAMLPAGLARIIIHQTRRFYWEEAAETYVPLTNVYDTGSTVGLRIDNYTDASHNNYVTIAAAYLSGDLAAACRIELENTFNDSARLSRVFIGQNARTNQTPTELWLESAELNAGGLTHSTLTDASYTGGTARFWVWTGLDEGQLGWWNLSAVFLAQCAAAPFRLIIVYSGSTESFDIQMRIRVNNVTTLWEGPWIAISDLDMQELGTVHLPPYLQHLAVLYPLELALYVRGRNAGTHSLTIDFAQLTPAECYRIIKPSGYHTAYGAYLILDEFHGQAYTDYGGALGNYVPYGSPIMLLPGRQNRLFFLMDNWTGGSEKARTANVRIAYRARRKTI